MKVNKKPSARFSLPSVLLLLFLPSLALAKLDPGLKTPYQLRVVLHVADNRFLTPIFQEQLERELRDHLQLTYRALAKVEVVRSHPLLREVLAKGLQQALAGWEELSNVRTHFVLIDFADGRYHLQARQHDGITGLTSPIVRRDSTGDRRLVAQKAARLVDRDFGLAGTVIESGGEIEVVLQGGGLGVPLERRLPAGAVFAVARITKEGNRLRSNRLPWAVLQTLQEPRQGRCRCKFWHRFQEDRLVERPGVVGYRCLQLATISAPVRLRLIDDVTFQPLAGVQVQVSRPDAQGPAQDLATNTDGLAVTRALFPHIALVRVVQGDRVRAQFPVELVDDRTVVCRLKIDADAETLEALEFRKDLWVRRLYDNLRVAVERVGELNSQLKKSLESAHASARAALAVLSEELTGLTLERDHLDGLASSRKVRLDLHEGEQRLEDLQGRRKELERFVSRLEAAIKEARSDETRALKQTIERARLLETEADFDQAIALYEKVLAERPDQAKIKSYLAGLKKAWTPQGKDHAQARQFIYTAWPALDPAGLKARLAEAEKAFALCRQADDRLTPQKLLLANVVHVANLKKRLASLRRQDTEDNRAEARALAQTADGLRRLHTDVRAFLSSKH
jgi:hypothetical protein